MKMTLRIISVGVLVLVTSCTYYSHDARVVYIPERDLQVTPTVVDLKVDFSKKISATSDPCETAKLAKDDALHKAIIQSDAAVLVDPIFEITQRGNVHVAKVTAFWGTYAHPRSAREEIASLGVFDLKTIRRFHNIYGSGPYVPPKAGTVPPKVRPTNPPPPTVSHPSRHRLKNLNPKPIAAAKVTRKSLPKKHHRFYVKAEFGSGDAIADGDDRKVIANAFEGTAKTREFAIGWNVTEHFMLEVAKFNFESDMDAMLVSGTPTSANLEVDALFLDLKYNILRLVAPQSRCSLILGFGAGKGTLEMDNVGMAGTTEEDKAMWRLSATFNVALTKNLDIFAGYQELELRHAKNNVLSSDPSINRSFTEDYYTSSEQFAVGILYRF